VGASEQGRQFVRAIGGPKGLKEARSQRERREIGDAFEVHQIQPSAGTDRVVEVLEDHHRLPEMVQGEGANHPSVGLGGQGPRVLQVVEHIETTLGDPLAGE
jgi:hypothetical protein